MVLRINFLLFASALLLSIASCKNPRVAGTDFSRQELLTIGHFVDNQIQNQCLQLFPQLFAFSKVIAQDREFSQKLLVENIHGAPEVSEAAVRYMAPMGFSILELVDSQQVVLSCGEFPANTGTSVAYKKTLLGEKGVFIQDTIQGKCELTVQAKVQFKILDADYYCYGGYIVDENFLKQFNPGNGFKILLKQGAKIRGMENAEGFSGLTDSTVSMNGKIFEAVTIALPVAGLGDAPSIIVIREKALPDKK